MLKLIQNQKYPLLILLIALIGYFWFMIYAPIYDFADEFFPGRMFMLQSIRNGIFPFWIPYQSMGLPMHGDPQAGTFYLPLWILSLFTEYTPYCWGIEYIFHTFIGGIGFFVFAKFFTTNKNIRFIAAVTFMLSGFYVGNVQHIAWIIAATWIPWILYATISLFEKPSLKYSLLLALFTSLLFTGGYPGFWIIAAYIFIALSIFLLITRRKLHNKLYYRKLILNLGLSAIVTIVLILPALISFIQISQYITRGAPLAYDLQISCSYSPRSFLSLIFPFIACSEGGFIQNDISMSSIYIGIILFPFVLFGLCKKQRSLTHFFMGIGVIAILLSMGNYLPFHKWVFEYVPFINMMRLPSIFRLFIIIPIIILALHGVESFFESELQKRKWAIYLLGGLMSIILLFMITADIFYKVAIVHEFKTLTWNNLLTKSLGFKFIFQGIIQLFLLGFPLLMLLLKKLNLKWVTLFIVIDLLINSTLSIHKTGYMFDRTNKELFHFFNEMPKNYIIPTEVTSSNQIYWKTAYPSLWRNLGIYSKQIEWFSYKGVILKNFEIMTLPNQKEGEELYFPKVAFYPEEVIYSDIALPLSLESAYSSDLSIVNNYHDSTSFLDLCVFEPGNIFIKTKTEIERPLIICQSYYPGWKAKLETGEHLEVTTLNSSMISVMVPQGEHYLQIYYYRPDLIFAFILQLLGYLSLIVLSIILCVKALK